MKKREFVSEREDLMKAWDWEKNNKLGLFPDKITCGNSIKAWWLCEKNHSFYASVSHKSNGRGCPYCAGHKVLTGYNDLQTKFPIVAKEWHLEKNHPQSPSSIIAGSKLKVWWRCQNGHEYQMPVVEKVQGNGCPICSNKRIVSGINDLATTHPHLVNEWDWEKNNKLGLFPDKISFGSTKNVWWRCQKCGFSWQTSPNSRTSPKAKTGCPCCSGRRVVPGINDLQTRYPEIAKKWHPTKNGLKPSEVTPFSNKEAWFICDKDSRHVFKTRIHLMTSGQTICPICSNQKIIVGVNDFQSTNPELMNEWHWYKNNEIGLYPTHVTHGSDKKAWWKCSKCNNSWQATIASRSGPQKCGCPKCKSYLGSSFPEKAISFYLSKYFVVKENEKFDWLGNSELDIYLSELNIAIEYDGKAWHNDTEKDAKKDFLCKEHGIILIRVREKDCPSYNSSAYKINRENYNTEGLNVCIAHIFKLITTLYHINFNLNINVETDYIKILEKIATGQKDKSIATSNLIHTWNYKKNGNLSPENISIGSSKKVWWICEKGHEWQATISSRSGKQKCGCPYCAGQKVLAGENDLATLYPHIAMEWDFSKNTKKPSEIRPMDNHKYWWICPVCKTSYCSSPSHRVGRNSGCPACARRKTLVSHFKKIINLDTNLIYDSIKEAAQKTGIHPSSISNCCNGKSKTAGGYHWKFVSKP